MAISVTRPQSNQKPVGCELKRSVDKHKPKNMKDLERICQEEWSKILPNVFLNLASGCTKY